MANILKIKRTAYGSQGVPQASEVTYGEWAWSNTNSKMYFTAADVNDGSDRILEIRDLIPVATTSAVGTVKPSATNFTITGAGALSIKAGGVTGNSIANDAVDSQHYEENSIDQEHISDNITLAGNCGTTGSFTVGTDLIVQGDTTTLNTSTLLVEDKEIEIAKNATDSATSDGAGIIVGGWTGCPSILYDDTGTQWEFNKPIEAQNGFNDTTFDGGAFTGA